MEEYKLHTRQRKLLYLLNCRHGIANGKELSAKLGISERTLRNDIAAVNEAMGAYGLQIKAVPGKGYYLHMEDRKVLHELFSGKENIQTKEDRIRYLIMKLVQSEEGCDLRDLEDDMFISRTTLENDIKEIRLRITENKPYLNMHRKGNFVSLDNDEIKKRNILIRLYCENWDYDSRDGIVLKDDVINQEILNQIRMEMKEILKKHEIELDDFGLIYLILAIAVSYSRMLEECRLEASDRICTERSVCEAVRELMDRLQILWELEIGEPEYGWIAAILEQLVLLNFKTYTKEEAVSRTDFRCRKLVEQLSGEMKERYHLDFSRDDRFYAAMLIHVQALMNSMISVQMQSRYLMEELKMQHPFLGDVSHYLCRRLEQLCDLKLDQEEENYLLPMLITSQGKLLENLRGKGIKTVVVSHLNASLTYYLMDRIQKLYAGKVDLEGPFPIYDRDNIDKVHPALIITTVQMDVFRKFDTPVITVSPLIDEKDQKKIEQHIQKAESEYLYPKLPNGKEACFRKDLMIQIERKADLTEVLSIMEENLRGNMYVSDEVQLDLKRCYYALLKNDMLFLYVIGDKAQKTIASIAECRYTIAWKQMRNIRKIMLMVINEEEQCYLGSFYQMAMDL